MSTSSSSTIGMFDSGVGGLTVLREVERLLPHDTFIYFGDTARCPYGPKGDKTIIRYSIENGIFLIDLGIELLIVACHTASALALNKLKATFSIPVLGVIEPAIEEACLVTKNRHIGVIGTRATINSDIYQRSIRERLSNATIFAEACPLFVPIVEEQFANEEVVRSIIKEYLAPLKKKNIDTLILGCTHYPLLEMLIQEEMGQDVQLVNPAMSCAKAALQLKQEKLPCKRISKDAHQFFVSDDPSRFQAIGERFFGLPLPSIQTVASFY